MLLPLSCMNDSYWRAAASGAATELRPWLRDTGSLTQRIRQRCGAFSVRNMKSGLAHIPHDESGLLKSAPIAWSRDVFLCADGQPVVFAHSTCAIRHLHGAWRALAELGNRPLGALLFSHPLIRRQPLHYKALAAQYPLYRRAAAILIDPPDRLWARRSLFYLHGAPLLVTEVFLPAILKLNPESSILNPI